VHWKSLFKDSTFRKEVVKLDGARVRTKARMQERAQEEAEAKIGEELRETLRMAVRKGAEKLERLRVDALLWKSKYVAVKAEVRLRREEQHMKAASEQREWDRAGEGATRRSANVVAELRANLDAAAGQAQVSFFCLRPQSFFLFMTPWHMCR
jgi:hypothetical protein